jgi:tetratricopeptide (TPR) repeat protein/transcriptional regulator with XRE-family HTH domain
MTAEGAVFGARLGAYRRSCGLSQAELAERSGLSVRAISNLERGRTRWPHPASIHRLADALELPAEARAEFAAAAGRRLRSAAASPVSTTPVQRLPQASEERVVPRQLPGPVRLFTGRQSELAALTGLLDDAGADGPAAMVISAIGGTAGVGKTALAVHWAHRAARQFPDGQLYVDLRGYDPCAPPMSAGDALAGFLRALGVSGQDIPGGADERAAAYRSLLSGRRVLVVLDNARHAQQVRPLLPGSPTCVTLVTSRDALAGLAAGDGAVQLEVGLLPLPEAVSLLRELIGSRVDDDGDAAVRLALQCGRLPLALRVAAELAVTRRGVALADLTAELADLQHRLDVLETDGDERTTVRAVLSWSYQALSGDVARLFRLVGLHPGPDLDGYAAASLSRTTLQRAGRLLDQLARAHLIQPTAPGRYGMHDLLRSYARELATTDSADERGPALTGLFDYYLRAAATSMDTAFPAERTRRPAVLPACTPLPALADVTAALTWLAAERPSLVAVTVHAAEHGWPDHATRLSATLFRYLDTECLYPEAITIHGHARQAARRTGDQKAEADALNSLGVIDLRQGRHQQAAGNFIRALALFRAAGDPLGEARALGNLGFVGFLQGQIHQAGDHIRQSLALFRQIGDEAGEARMLTNLGYVDLRQGRYQQAVEHLRRSLALCGDIHDPGGQARALGTLGEVSLRQGHYRQAAGQVHQALALFRSIGDQISEADALACLGMIDLRQGRYQQAAGHLDLARALSREHGDLSSQANTINVLGELLLATGHHADARTQHAEALSLAVQAGEKYEQAHAHAGLAGAYRASGEFAEARRHQQQALTLYTYLGAPEADRIRSQLADEDNHVASA